MSKQKTFIRNQFSVPSLIRHVILSWLLAVVIEYFILPNELRDLAKLDGLAQMSFVRVIGITCGIAVLLTGISFLFKTKKIERWCIVAAWKPTVAALGIGGIIFLLAGGISYTIGAGIYYFLKKYRYAHSIFHLFVLIGSILQMFAVLFYVV